MSKKAPVPSQNMLFLQEFVSFDAFEEALAEKGFASGWIFFGVDEFPGSSTFGVPAFSSLMFAKTVFNVLRTSVITGAIFQAFQDVGNIAHWGWVSAESEGFSRRDSCGRTPGTPHKICCSFRNLYPSMLLKKCSRRKASLRVGYSSE